MPTSSSSEPVELGHFSGEICLLADLHMRPYRDTQKLEDDRLVRARFFAVRHMTPLTPAVAQKIEALFAPECREAAGRMIAERCGADLPLSTHMGPDPSGFDRIRFAVLKLSHGDLERLRREVDGAHVDWRDTLMAAGFGEDIYAHLQWNP